MSEFSSARILSSSQKVPKKCVSTCCEFYTISFRLRLEANFLSSCFYSFFFTDFVLLSLLSESLLSLGVSSRRDLRIERARLEFPLPDEELDGVIRERAFLLNKFSLVSSSHSCVLE